MQSEFEEKTYENYFNAELSSKSSVFFPIGQVQEGFLGFDSAANSRNWSLFRFLGYPFWFFPRFKGIKLKEIANSMELLLKREINNVPKMKVNLLFQYKRSDFMVDSKAKEWINWNQSYFRYHIYQKQQELLLEIHNKYKNDVLILYAAPAIYQMDKLVKAHQKKQIINKSNFRKAKELKNHNKNTFIEAGNYSIACSEPERIDNFDLIELIENYENENTNKTNSKFIIDFRKKIESVVYKNENYRESFRILNDPYNQMKEYDLLYSFISMNNLRLLTGLQWIIKLKNNI